MMGRRALRPSPRCTQAVILVGGEGKRLRPDHVADAETRHPLVERPFVTYSLDNLARHGVERAVLSSGYLAEAIETAIGDGCAYGVHVDHVRETEPLGTAGAIANCASVLEEGPLFVFNGDVLNDVDLTAMAAAHAARNRAATICLTEVDDPSRYGVVRLHDDGSVAEFVEKPSVWRHPALINAGVYVLDREVLDLVPRGVEFSIECGIFPRLADDAALYGFTHAGYWCDIGTPHSYLQAHFDVLEGAVRTATGEQLDAQAGCVVGVAAEVERSILVRGARVGARAQIVDAVLGEASRVGADTILVAGTRLYPDDDVPEGVAELGGEFVGVGLSSVAAAGKS